MDTTRQILVGVWQKKPLYANDFLYLTDKFDLEIVVEVLKDLNDRVITVNEAEADLQERRWKCQI